MESEGPRGPAIFWWGLLFEAGLGLLACGVGWLLERQPLEKLHGDIHDAGVGLLAALPMLVMFFACVRWPIGPLRGIQEFCDEVIRPLFASCSTLQLGLIALSAGIGEELLFRGLLQRLCTDWLGLWPGIVLVSIVFGLMHLITVTYAVLAALMGLYMSGIMLLANDNLLSVIIAHAVYDFVALLVLVKAPAEET